MFMYILSEEGYGEIHPTRPCSHDFMAKPSLYTLPQDTIHDEDGCNGHSCSKPQPAPKRCATLTSTLVCI